jgi:hypothetical protein
MSVLFLFGAGASRGSERDLIPTPALGADLFQALRVCAPLEWGKLDLKYGDLFRKDFEKGMNLVLAQQPRDVSELQRAMAAYFFSFSPSSKSLYIRLIQRLGIKDMSFASLNYDRLLEEAILKSGFSPNYHLETKKEKEVHLCLPHGCCNLFLNGFDFPPGTLSYTYADDVFDSSELELISDYKKFQNKLKSQELTPVMACFDQKKTCAIGKKFIEAQKIRFEKMVRSAELIVIIGVHVREHDHHIWTPLAKTSAKLVCCSGKKGGEVFKAWSDKSRTGKSDQIFFGCFASYFEKICEIAEDFLRSLTRSELDRIHSREKCKNV